MIKKLIYNKKMTIGIVFIAITVFSIGAIRVWARMTTIVEYQKIPPPQIYESDNVSANTKITSSRQFDCKFINSSIGVVPISDGYSALSALNKNIGEILTGYSDTIASINETKFTKNDLNNIQNTNSPTLQVRDKLLVEKNIVIPNGVNIEFENGGAFIIPTGTTITMLGKIIARPSKIFEGEGNIIFPFGSDSNAFLPEWWGADSGLNASGKENSQAFNRMIESLPEKHAYPQIILHGSRYNLEGNPAINFDRSLQIVGRNPLLNYTGDGICVQIGRKDKYISRLSMDGITIKRGFSRYGPAKDTLVGVGLKIVNTKNFRIVNPNISGFGIGLDFLGDEGGTGYGLIIEPVIITNLVGINIGSTNNQKSWCNAIHFLGGRLGFDTDMFKVPSESAGSALVNINSHNPHHKSDGIIFTGTVIENLTERKVSVSGNWIVFENCYWDQGSEWIGKPHVLDTKIVATAGNSTIKLSEKFPGLLRGDLVRITASTNHDDNGCFVILANDNGELILNHKFNETYSDLSAKIIRTNILLTENSSIVTINGGTGLSLQAIADLGRNNLLIDPVLGIINGNISNCCARSGNK